MSRALFAITTALACALAAPASADSELVVVATRVPTEPDRLPATVDTVDRDTIEREGLVTLADALRTLSGVTVASTGQPGAQTSVFIRGANSKHTLALYDGVRVNDPTAPNGQYDFGQDLLADIARIEVLRGAASSVHGSDAIGGVVNLVPRRGGESAFAPWFDVAAGSFVTRRGALGATGAVGALDYGVSAEALATDGFDQTPARFSTHDGDHDGADIYAATATASYALTDALSIDGLVRTRSARADFDSFSAGPSGFQRGDDPDLAIARDAYTLWRAGVTHDSGGVTLRVAGGQVRNERRERDNGAITTIVEGRRDFADASATLERNTFGPFADAAVSAGVQWSEDSIANSATAFANALRADDSLLAGYVVARARLGAGADLAASVRHDDHDRAGAENTWTLGASHRLGPFRVRASHGTAFKAPTLAERFDTGFFNVGNAALEAERSRASEIGVDWTQDGFELAATAWRTRIRNLIEYDFARLQNINIGRAAIDGVEARLRAPLTETATLQARYTWTDARQTSAPGEPRLARRAPHAWAMEADWQVKPALDLAFEWRWVSSQPDVTYDNNGFFLSAAGRNAGYDTGRLALRYRNGGGLETWLTVDNLADQTIEAPNAFAGAGRTVMVGLRGRR